MTLVTSIAIPNAHIKPKISIRQNATLSVIKNAVTRLGKVRRTISDTAMTAKTMLTISSINYDKSAGWTVELASCEWENEWWYQKRKRETHTTYIVGVT